jgi:hypothetical protein
MRKRYIIFLLLSALSFLNCSENNADKINERASNSKMDSNQLISKETVHYSDSIFTKKYAGIYSYGSNVEEEPVGSLTVFPESDSTVLIYLDVCRGAPSYNLGQLRSRLAIQNDTALYFYKDQYADNGCKLLFAFTNEEINVTTIEGYEECGFGHAVYADGKFILSDKNIPAYFIGVEGDTIYFSELKKVKNIY